ncbi:MAG: hypothetical protein KAY24_08495, partial [Candidatus Eisenbacteria sp.]|nr:hypothetical protein [Candidatus Eisenbacteria bacterium]
MNAVAPALFILAVSVGLSLSACALLRRRAIQYRLVTSRDPERGGPGGVPTLGGVGVLLGLGGGCIAALALA